MGIKKQGSLKTNQLRYQKYIKFIKYVVPFLILTIILAFISSHFRSLKSINVNNVLKIGDRQVNSQSLDPAYQTLEVQIRQVLEQHASVDRNIIFCTANYYFVKNGFVKTWIEYLRMINVKSFFIGAQDKETYDFLKAEGCPAIFYNSKLQSNHVGGPGDMQMLAKINTSVIMAQMGYNQVYTELDVIWLEDPIKIMRRYKDRNIDLMMGSDSQNTTTDDDGFEKQVVWRTSPGIMLMRNTCLPLLQKWLSVLEYNFNHGVTDVFQLWDQPVLNHLSEQGPFDDNGDRTFQMYTNAIGSPLRVAILNSAIFADGHTFSVQRLAERRGFRPACVHFAYTQGKMSKVHRQREEKMWWDDEEYYNPKNSQGFIKFDMQVPDQILKDSTPKKPNTGFSNFEGQFALINYQFKQMRQAMMLAILFNRTLIFDPFWTSVDQFWYPHDGWPFEIVNATEHFKAPLDHILDIVNLYNQTDWDQDIFGPPLYTREHGFLENKKVPYEVVNNHINIYSCTNSTCVKNASQEQIRNLVIKPPVTETQIKAIMKEFKDIKVWTFKDLQGIFFSGFDDKSLQTKFYNRIAQLGGRFCCARGATGPADAWYDPLFDILPHTDRFNRPLKDRYKILPGQDPEKTLKAL